MTNFSDNNHCFVCGRNNPHGLKLEFRHVPGNREITTDVVFPSHFQGWSGVVHGGLVSTVLDEIMVKATESEGYTCVTAEIFIRFKKPALTGSRYRAVGRITDIKRKLIFTDGEITDMENQVIARASAKFFMVGRK